MYVMCKTTAHMKILANTQPSLMTYMVVNAIIRIRTSVQNLPLYVHCRPMADTTLKGQVETEKLQMLQF